RRLGRSVDGALARVGLLPPRLRHVPCLRPHRRHPGALALLPPSKPPPARGASRARTNGAQRGNPRTARRCRPRSLRLRARRSGAATAAARGTIDGPLLKHGNPVPAAAELALATLALSPAKRRFAVLVTGCHHARHLILRPHVPNPRHVRVRFLCGSAFAVREQLDTVLATLPFVRDFH